MFIVVDRLDIHFPQEAMVSSGSPRLPDDTACVHMGKRLPMSQFAISRPIHEVDGPSYSREERHLDR